MPPNKPDTPINKAPSISNRTELTLSDLAIMIKKSAAATDTKIASLAIKLDSYDKNLSSIKSSIVNLSTSLSELKSDNHLLREEINTLRDKVLLLESSSSITQISNPTDLVQETQERLRRAKNVIFFNIDKPESTNPQVAHETSNELITALGLQVSIRTAKWIGRDSLKNRPLLVELDDTDSVYKILKYKTKLKECEKWSRVWASADLTLIQRAHMKKLRDELSHRRSHGEPNLIIKYNNGNPMICPKN